MNSTRTLTKGKNKMSLFDKLPVLRASCGALCEGVLAVGEQHVIIIK